VGDSGQAVDQRGWRVGGGGQVHAVQGDEYRGVGVGGDEAVGFGGELSGPGELGLCLGLFALFPCGHSGEECGDEQGCEAAGQYAEASVGSSCFFQVSVRERSAGRQEFVLGRGELVVVVVVFPVVSPSFEGVEAASAE
jgi:hypothetical protein